MEKTEGLNSKQPLELSVPAKAMLELLQALELTKNWSSETKIEYATWGQRQNSMTQLPIIDGLWFWVFLMPVQRPKLVNLDEKNLNHEAPFQPIDLLSYLEDLSVQMSQRGSGVAPACYSMLENANLELLNEILQKRVTLWNRVLPYMKKISYLEKHGLYEKLWKDCDFSEKGSIMLMLRCYFKVELSHFDEFCTTYQLCDEIVRQLLEQEFDDRFEELTKNSFFGN